MSDYSTARRPLFGAVAFCRAAALLPGCHTTGTPPASPFSATMMLPEADTHRASTYDRTGGNMDARVVEPGEVLPVLDAGGPGCVRHIYWTYIVAQPEVRRHVFRDMILRMYWDGETSPSVECPLGDFFGVAGCIPRPIKSLALTANPGTDATDTSWGFNCYFPMPFQNGARIEITNDGPEAVALWVHADYETYDHAPEWLYKAGRFHAQWRRSNLTVPVDSQGINTTGDANYVILEVKGRGSVAGYVLTVDNRNGGWWGEGDDMVFIDGETWPPSFHGTGTEEIFGAGACPNVEYSGPYTGMILAENAYGDPWYGKNSLYRFFLADRINFRKSVRITIEHGHANDLANDYVSVAYWYQDEPHAPFPPLPDAAGRMPLGPPRAPMTVKGAIEGESLVDKAVSSGPPFQALRFAGTWSGNQFLWFVAGKPGATITLPVEVSRTGKHRVAAYLVKASDFGIVQLLVDNKPLGEPIDCYNNEGGAGATHVIPTGEIDFGTVDLKAGQHTLSLEVVDKNPKAASYFAGVDCIVLKPLM